MKQLRLINFSFSESIENKLLWEIKPVTLENLNLIMGDNAQGKTRFFNVLRFLKNIHSGTPLQLNPSLSSEINMSFDDSGIPVIYKLTYIVPSQSLIPIFQEEIVKGSQILFSRAGNSLIDEVSGTKLENFFLPLNVPAIVSLQGDKFPTFNKLRSFFNKMLFLEANRFSPDKISLEKNAFVPNSNGSNIGVVLQTWKNSMPEAYQEVISEFEDCFEFISKKSIVIREENLPGQSITIPQVFFREKESGTEIRQLEWSDGMSRTLCLFSLPATRFPGANKSFERPSMICVDEIENGLDFTTMSNVISFYEGYTNLMQIIIASHSPTVCNLIDPQHWLITKRKGPSVEFIAPNSVEPNLNEERKKLLKDNWDFYKNHISKSKLYIVH